MNPEDTRQAEIDSTERLPWHMPEVKRLDVAVDTANAQGSGPDGGTVSFVA